MITDGGVIMCKCNKSGKSYGMTLVKFGKGREGYWEHHWTFPLDDKAAGREGYGASITIREEIKWADNWPGCPYCGNGGYFQCGSCGKISCHGGESQVLCQWCKTTCNISGTIESIDIGGGF